MALGTELSSRYIRGTGSQMLQLRKKYFEVIAGQPVPGGRLLRIFLRAASVPYSLAIRVRNWLFDLRGGVTVGVPVVSVGNVTTGGTGKTPVVALIAEFLAGQAVQPGIISRGYRSMTEVDGETVNDEKRVLEILCPDVPHVQNGDRIAASRECLAKFRTDLLVADDAFQHRRLARDLDIVLVDALCPLGHGFVLPRGLLREPVGGLARADLVILTRAGEVTPERRDEIWKELHRHSLSFAEIEIDFEPGELIDLVGTRTPIPVDEADSNSPASEPPATRRVVAFCGIGNPEGFRRTLSSAGFELVDLLAFPDHHHYTRDDLRELCARARTAGCGLITTLKDLVKINGEDIASDISLRALNIRARVSRGEEILRAELEKLAEMTARSRIPQPEE